MEFTMKNQIFYVIQFINICNSIKFNLPYTDMYIHHLGNRIQYNIFNIILSF